MRRCLFLLALACCLPVSGHAQSTESSLKTRLVGQPLYLRGAWDKDTLHFDSTGQLAGNSGHRSFMLCGVDIKDVHLEKDQLVLDGERVGVELHGTASKRVFLKANDANPFHHKEPVHIEISRPSNGDYDSALAAIFVHGLAELTPLLPEYWQTYAHKAFFPTVAASTVQSPAISPNPVKKIGGGITPPVLLHSKEPRGNEDALKQGYGGTVLIGMVIDKNGLPTQLELLQPIGMGLDEDVLSAVQNYRFKPSTENGLPVSFRLDIKIDLGKR